jgi:hypothetical protein
MVVVVLNQQTIDSTTTHLTRMADGLRSMEASQSDALAREIAAFSQHLNVALVQYEELACYLPLTSENLFEKLRDGVILGYLLHHYYPGCIRVQSLVRGMDLALMNHQHTKVTFEVNANLNLVVNSAKSVKNLVVVNLGGEDILQCNRDLVLGLLWQIFNTKLAGNISLQAHPELVRLVEGNESLVSLAQLRSEALLNRWFNFHLQKAGIERRVSNLGKDLIDSELYAHLIRQIAPRFVSEEDVREILDIDGNSTEGLIRRAQKVLDLADRLGCHEFASPQDIVAGHQRLNYAFTATLFNKHIGISLPSDEEVQRLKKQLQEISEERDGLQMALSAMESELKLIREQAHSEKELFEKRSEELCLEHSNELERERAHFALAKDELAAQYKDSLDSALDCERRAHQDEIWELLSKEKDSRRQLFAALSVLRQQCAVEDLENGKYSECDESAEMDDIIKATSELAMILARKTSGLAITTENLKTAVAHKEKVNEIMGDKIREYTEQVIHIKKADTARRGSLLKRIFASPK